MDILKVISAVFIAEQEGQAQLMVSDANTPVDVILPQFAQIRTVTHVQDAKTGQVLPVDVVGVVLQKRQ